MSPCGGNCSCEKGPVDNAHIEEELNKADDDIWGDEEPVDSHADIKRTHEKQGYLDGLMDTQESKLQEGFDDSFPIGAQLGITVGEILGRFMAAGKEDLFQESKKELQITNVLNKTYFDSELEMKGEHDLLKKWHGILREHT